MFRVWHKESLALRNALFLLVSYMAVAALLVLNLSTCSVIISVLRQVLDC